MRKSKKPDWLSDKPPEETTVLTPLSDGRGKYPRHKTELAQKEKPWAEISDAETLEEFKQEVATTTEIRDLVNVKKIDDLISMLITFMTDPDKMQKASYKDMAIVYGILCDKRANAIGTHLKRTGGNLHLRAVFRGEGAIEVHTGDK